MKVSYAQADTTRHRATGHNDNIRKARKEAIVAEARQYIADGRAAAALGNYAEAARLLNAALDTRDIDSMTERRRIAKEADGYGRMA